MPTTVGSTNLTPGSAATVDGCLIRSCSSVRDRVALITVNDPDRRNIMTAETSAGMRAAMARAEADTNVHAVIVTGAGSAFCAGADLSDLGSAPAPEGLHQIYDGFLAVADCILPTVAAVNGPAVGAGLNLALACDVRIAGPQRCSIRGFRSSVFTLAAARPGCFSGPRDQRWPGRRCCSACGSMRRPRYAMASH